MVQRRHNILYKSNTVVILCPLCNKNILHQKFILCTLYYILHVLYSHNIGIKYIGILFLKVDFLITLELPRREYVVYKQLSEYITRSHGILYLSQLLYVYKQMSEYITRSHGILYLSQLLALGDTCRHLKNIFKPSLFFMICK